MSEIISAFGLLQLQHIDIAIAARKGVDEHYRSLLSNVEGIECMPYDENSNFTYFPIFVTKEYPLSRDALFLKLKYRGIVARRYFYPLISEFPMYKNLPSASADNLPVATSISRVVLCLPIFPNLSQTEIEYISSIISNN